MTDPTLFPVAAPTAQTRQSAPLPRPALPGPSSAAGSTAKRVETAIAQAARSTRIDFDFLLAQAKLESAMDPQARAQGSSATGLYQFIESTWLETVKKHGGRFGLDNAAARIEVARDGSATVADPSQRAAILAMRDDPQIASFMAAGLAEDNRAQLQPVLGRQPDNNELYLAHFLGASGASRFLSMMTSDPDQSAASLFARPAEANPSMFYTKAGEARSLAGVMDVIGAKMDAALSQTALSQSASPSPNSVVTAPSRAGVGVGAGAYLSQKAAPLSLPAAAIPSASFPAVSRPAMSKVLASSWQESGASSLASAQSTGQVRRAYAQLAALGF